MTENHRKKTENSQNKKIQSPNQRVQKKGIVKKMVNLNRDISIGPLCGHLPYSQLNDQLLFVTWMTKLYFSCLAAFQPCATNDTVQAEKH